MRLATALLALSLVACDDSAPGVTIQSDGDAGHDLRAMVGEAARQVSIGVERSELMELYRAQDYARFVRKMEAFAEKTQAPVDRYNLACGYALNGQPDQAIAELTLLVERGETFNMASDADFDSLRDRAAFQALLTRAAQLEEAHAAIEPIREMAMERYRQERFAEFTVMMEKVYEYGRDDTDLYNLACGYALTGDSERAIATLHDLATRDALLDAEGDSDFDSLHGDPRFQALFADD